MARETQQDPPAAPAVPDEIDDGLGFREVAVEFQDGHTENLFPDAPAVVFTAKRVGFDELDDEVLGGFVMLWLAAGKPGLNGETLTRELGLDLTGAWLEQQVKRVRAVQQRANPTSRARRRR